MEVWALEAGTPETFNVLIKEMQSLGLEVKVGSRTSAAAPALVSAAQPQSGSRCPQRDSTTPARRAPILRHGGGCANRLPAALPSACALRAGGSIHVEDNVSHFGWALRASGHAAREKRLVLLTSTENI
jgi:hypothetical protein